MKIIDQWLSALYEIYWFIGRIIYSKRMHIGKNAKIRWGGAVKAGQHIWIGRDFFIGKHFLLAVYPKDGHSRPIGRLKIGNRVCAQERVRISCIKSVVIEDDVLMGSNILITDNDHGMNPVSRLSYMEQASTSSPVHIGKGCWIGEQTVILAGSNIGEKCIIGANSVVKGNVPSYSVAVGSPAKVIKRWDFEKGAWVKN